jgi:hypothetical protein
LDHRARSAGADVDLANRYGLTPLIDGPSALRDALLARPDVFVGTVTEKLMIYALGRGLEAYDMPVVRRIVRNSAADHYAMQSIIMGIVKSRPFQMRAKFALADGSPNTKQGTEKN